MLNSNFNWDGIPSKIKRAIETSLEHLNEHKFLLNDTNIEYIDDYCWDLSKSSERQLGYFESKIYAFKILNYIDISLTEVNESHNGSDLLTKFYTNPGHKSTRD